LPAEGLQLTKYRPYFGYNLLLGVICIAAGRGARRARNSTSNPRRNVPWLKVEVECAAELYTRGLRLGEVAAIGPSAGSLGSAGELALSRRTTTPFRLIA
jgi:hypothetical protein